MKTWLTQTRFFVYGGAVLIVFCLVAHYAQQSGEVEAALQRDLKTLQMLYALEAERAAIPARVKAESDARQRAYERDRDEIVRRTEAGESWAVVRRDIDRRKEDARQEEILQELKAIRARLDDRARP